MISFINKTTSLIEFPKRVLGPFAPKQFTNIERYTDFNFKLKKIHRMKGISCMLRVKNEEERILACLDSVSSVFNEVIFVYNGSTDNTVAIVKDFIERNNDSKIKVYHYPHNVSRCGVENEQTPENSVSSLAYYYNWCLSKCDYSYVFKWDADMLIHPSDKVILKKRLNNLTSWWPTFVEIEVQTIYLKDHSILSIANDVNKEIRIFPNRADVYFKKEKLFENLKAKFYKVIQFRHRDIRVYEVKNTAVDEFSHWSTRDFMTERKKIEWENYKLISTSNIISSENIKILYDEDLESAIVGEKYD